MNYVGVIIGLATFLIIGLFHPIVIKAEYHFGKQCWWVFAIAGLLFCLGSLLVYSRTLRAGKACEERMVPFQSQA